MKRLIWLIKDLYYKFLNRNNKSKVFEGANVKFTLNGKVLAYGEVSKMKYNEPITTPITVYTSKPISFIVTDSFEVSKKEDNS